TRERWAILTDALLDAGFGRDSAIVAVGGGVVGDLAGFVAATYLRGIPFLQVPTTLLAMLDASVGGKVGVDTPRGKNLVGAFHPPEAVLADPRVLADLPERDYRMGLAEAVKHGVIADAEYFAWIEREAPRLLERRPATLAHLVQRSVEIKADVVGDDERESGRRAVLNAGHTVAHALEQVSGYALPHGEAVGLGLLIETRLAEARGWCRPGVAARIRALLTVLGLPVRLDPGWRPDRLVEAMALDKKNRGGAVRIAPAADLGQAVVRDGGWTVAVPPEAMRAVLAESV
ncbi:MAG TPA: 3-dehydroquinate synthase, partial [Gemmatimonadales bacterium]|nr:3-dehydroquinate synthase [Gemmatimonadales bacterium]